MMSFLLFLLRAWLSLPLPWLFIGTDFLRADLLGMLVPGAAE